MDGGPYSFRGTERFQLIRLIGHGGMGVVYEAYDTVNASSVALKLLPLVSPDSLLRFKREFRSVADIRHPNLVRLGELVAHEAQWFFTMELVDGVDLIAYVRGHDAPAALPAAPAVLSPGPGDSTAVGPHTVPDVPSAPVDGANPRLRPALAHLAQGLMALHEAGCVHRDVKPSNMLITRQGRGVLLDFGLASTASDETTMVGAGTPMYMAPEQAMPAPVTAAVDWYAFGVILFELLTGRLPFEGRPHEILYHKNHGRPPAVAALQPDAPADLAQLCDHLLDPDPARRPGGAEVLACLAAPATSTRPRPAPDVEVPLVGRTHELASLATALADVRAGRGPRAVIVRGESGVGKSSLVRAFLDGPAAAGDALRLTARCYERELLPFKAVDGLVDALTRELRRLDGATVTGLLPRRADLLLQAFPVLGRVPAFARARREPLALDPAEVRSAMFTAFRELITATGKRAPIVAFVDDLQWADRDSVALLGELLSAREDAPRVLLLGTLRTVGASEGEPERLFPPELGEQSVLVGNLDPEAARSLARDLLRAHGGPPGEQEAARLVQESAGHPLFLRELVRTARTTTDDGAPATLEGVLSARIGELPPAAIRLLRVLAVAGAPVPLRLVRRATELDGPETARLLDELRAARLVHSGSEGGDDVVVIAHDRVRQVVMGALTSAGEAKEVHERLAQAFEDGGDVLGAGEHWREAGAPERAAVHFATAARQAAAALAFDRAASHYNNALAMGLWTDEQRNELQVNMADALSNAGRGPAAARHYLAAADRATGARALDLRRRAVEELLRAGNVDEGLIAAFTAVEAAGLEFAQQPLRKLLWLRAVLRLRGLRFRRRAPDDIAAHELARIDLCWSLSSGLGLTDHFQGAHFQARGLLLALRSGDLPRVARGIAGEAAYAAAVGNYRRAGRHLERATRLAEETGQPHTLGIVSLMKGLSSHLHGQFALGLGHLTTAEQIFRERCVGTHWELAAVRQYSLECLYYLGELPRFESGTSEGIREAHDRGSLYAATTLRTGVTNTLWLLRDEPDRARHDLDEAMKPWSSHGYHIQHWYELIARTQIDLYTGATGEAWDRMERTWPALAGSGLLHLPHARIVGLHLKARAAIAKADGKTGQEREQLLAVARRCARRVWHEGGGWNRALAAAAYAGIERVAGRPARADAWLNRALSSANTHGLALLVAAAELACGDPRGAAWMSERGVRAPAALARMLLPGCVAQASP